VILTPLLSATLSVSSVAEPQLLGTWVSVQRSAAGRGSIITIRRGGKLESSVGYLDESWYRVEGNKIIRAPPLLLTEPWVSTFHIEGDRLRIRHEGHSEFRYVRIGNQRAGAASLLGVWREEDGGEIVEYTAEGLRKSRIATKTTPGTYDLAKQTITSGERMCAFACKTVC